MLRILTNQVEGPLLGLATGLSVVMMDLHIYIDICIYIFSVTGSLSIYQSIHPSIYRFICIYIYIYTHIESVCVRVHIHLYIYIHMQTGMAAAWAPYLASSQILQETLCHHCRPFAENNSKPCVLLRATCTTTPVATLPIRQRFRGAEINAPIAGEILVYLAWLKLQHNLLIDDRTSPSYRVRDPFCSTLSCYVHTQR